MEYVVAVLVAEIDGTKSAFALPDGMPIFIGRSEVCDITVRVPGVSRRHAVFLLKNGICGVRDLESSNGTYVNGARIEGSHALRDGDTVRIASLRFTLRLRGAVTVPEKPGSFDEGVSGLRLPRAMLSGYTGMRTRPLHHTPTGGLDESDTRVMPKSGSDENPVDRAMAVLLGELVEPDTKGES